MFDMILSSIRLSVANTYKLCLSIQSVTAPLSSCIFIAFSVAAL